jgi:hypothetical protein
MEQYVALDVSLKEISVCIIDSEGAVVFEGTLEKRRLLTAHVDCGHWAAVALQHQHSGFRADAARLAPCKCPYFCLRRRNQKHRISAP